MSGPLLDLDFVSHLFQIVIKIKALVPSITVLMRREHAFHSEAF